MKRLSHLVILTLVAGCSLAGNSESEPDGVTFTSEQSSYPLGSTARVTLANNTDERITQNLCHPRLERRQDSEWMFIGPKFYCPGVLQVIEPGESKQYRIPLADSLGSAPSTTYRITTKAGIKGESVTLATAPFEVIASAQQQ